MKKAIAENKFLRKIFFPLISKINFEMTVTHDVTKRKFSLLTWDHKGYWYYGKHREKAELIMFERLINLGDCVLEVGGHIGYVTQIFENLVGDKGKVFVAEPTPKSRLYLKKNVRHDSTVLPIAVSDKNGEMDFYTEEFGGFTNSLVGSFTEKTNKNLSDSQVSKFENSIKKISVQVKTIDALCEEFAIQPTFLKIDVEGAELSVLKGAKKSLNNVKSLMVEVSRNHSEIFELMKAYNFLAFDSDGVEIPKNISQGNRNIFFEKHASS